MATSKATLTRRPSSRMFAYVTVALATVLGLFAMHGAPMTMTMTAPTSHAVGSPILVSMIMNQASTQDQPSPGSPEHASGSVAGNALTTGIRTSGTHGGCAAEHDGCVATFRVQSQVLAPAGGALLSTQAASAAQSLRAYSERFSVWGLALRPPCLDELCVSRT